MDFTRWLALMMECITGPIRLCICIQTTASSERMPIALCQTHITKWICFVVAASLSSPTVLIYCYCGAGNIATAACEQREISVTETANKRSIKTVMYSSHRQRWWRSLAVRGIRIRGTENRWSICIPLHALHRLRTGRTPLTNCWIRAGKKGWP